MAVARFAEAVEKDMGGPQEKSCKKWSTGGSNTMSRWEKERSGLSEAMDWKQKLRIGAPWECAGLSGQSGLGRPISDKEKDLREAERKSCGKSCRNGDASKPGSGEWRHLEDSQESVSPEVVGRSSKSGTVRYRLQLAKRVAVQGGARTLAGSS